MSWSDRRHSPWRTGEGTCVVCTFTLQSVSRPFCTLVRASLKRSVLHDHTPRICLAYSSARVQQKVIFNRLSQASCANRFASPLLIATSRRYSRLRSALAAADATWLQVRLVHEWSLRARCMVPVTASRNVAYWFSNNKPHVPMVQHAQLIICVTFSNWLTCENHSGRGITMPMYTSFLTYSSCHICLMPYIRTCCPSPSSHQTAF